MSINDWYLFQGPGNVIAFQRVVGPKLMGLDPDEAAIEAVLPKAHAVFAEFSVLLGDPALLRRRSSSRSRTSWSQRRWTS